MSALGQKRTLLHRKRHVRWVKSGHRNGFSQQPFDHLVGLGEQHGGHGKAERLGGLEVDEQFVLCWGLHRPPIADIGGAKCNVGFGPLADKRG